MRKVRPEQLANIADPNLRVRMMRDTVKLVQQVPELGFVLMSLIASFIDGLAKGKPNGTRKAYLHYLKEHFPTLCSALGAEVFYSHFRSCAVHEFATRPPFGLAHGGSGEYVATQEVNGEPWSFLNVDKLAADFLHHLDSLQTGAKR